ncbi:hypothetical protein ABF237_002497 [Yersinia ruckeri]
MPTKIAVVYIGPKEKKRDTITGSRLVFPRLKPVEVESAIAHQLLDFPTVFVRHDELEKLLEAKQQSVLDRAYQLALEEDGLRQQTALNSFVVKVGSDEVDLAKMTSVQLATLVESEDLGIKQGAQEKVDDFRLRVRESINAKVEAE